jgi:hypothetical protein
MPLLRINATTRGLRLHGQDRSFGQSVSATLAEAAHAGGPAVIMVHGYKYSPFVAGRCPHGRIFRADAWPKGLDLASNAGLGIAFGWHARGGLATAYDTAINQAAQMAQLVSALRCTWPVHIIAHSLGATLVLAALPYLRSGDVGRIVLLSGAAHTGLAHHALQSPAGQDCTLFHVTSGENLLFDLGFEHMIPGSGAIGRGLDSPRALRIPIDCAPTLAALAGLGFALAPPQRRVCHWSSYTRAGVMALNGALLSGALPLEHLRAALPVPCARRWTLALALKTRIMARAGRATAAPQDSTKGTPHGHAI